MPADVISAQVATALRNRARSTEWTPSPNRVAGITGGPAVRDTPKCSGPQAGTRCDAPQSDPCPGRVPGPNENSLTCTLGTKRRLLRAPEGNRPFAIQFASVGSRLDNM